MGLAEEEIEGRLFKEIKCTMCGIKSNPNANFCSGCSLVIWLRKV